MYQAVYKCRLCGKVFQYDKTYKRNSALRKIWSFNDNIPYISNNMQYTVHDCQDGSIGLADFIGFRKVEEC